MLNPRWSSKAFRGCGRQGLSASVGYRAGHFADGDVEPVAMTNLIEKRLNHNGPGTRVTLVIERCEDRVALRVTDE